jgi:O-antigen/teichoic acid export membrane protein
MTQSPTKETDQLGRHMFRGSAWTIAVRWCVRVLGLANTVILARLLTPADYGIVTIGTMIVGLVEVFGQAGQNSAIVRHPKPSREHYDSAWTLSLLFGLGLGAVVWLLTPITIAYFHEPRAKLVVEVLAFRTMLTGAANVGVLNFRRNLQFNKQFIYNLTPFVVSSIVTLSSALYFRNYWALVVGILSWNIASVLLSYLMEPFRPRICFSKIGEIWSFSFWLLFKNIGTYFSDTIDQMAIGRFGGSAQMGRYHVAVDLASSPSAELVGPVTSTLFPVMATVQHDREKRRELYLTVLYYTALICTSTAIGVALVADDMVDFVLGPQWADLKILIPWLALAYGVLGLGESVYIALATIGEARLSARLQWVRLIGLALTIFHVAFYFCNLEMVALTRLVVTILVIPALFFAIMKQFDFTTRDFIVIVWRPVAAGLTMAVVVLGLNQTVNFSGPIRLLADVAAGIASYGGMLMFLWWANGQPHGPEKMLWRRLKPTLAVLSR